MRIDPQILLIELMKVKVSLLVFIVLSVGILSGFVREIRNLPASEDQEIIPASNGFYPLTPWYGDPIVVRVPASTNLGMKLALCSLQGLVNRHVARIYLDIEGPANMSFMLRYLGSEYYLWPREITMSEFLVNYSNYARGLVVYDSKRPATVNVATVVAGIDDYVIVDESIAVNISSITGLPIALDLTLPPWAGLTDSQLQSKSFDEYYPRTNRTMLAILIPDRIGSRDYLVAARVWTFYARQGPFASQEEIDFTERVLSSTPHNIPVFGWFEAPTLVEENFFVQMASRYGKYLMGGQDVPNLSYLTSIRPRRPFVQDWHENRLYEPRGDGVYISLAIPDGDNLDFVAGKMSEFWQEWKEFPDKTGFHVPVTWSINPQLAELAPPLFDYYYGPSASFIAAPSGGGYLYPGFAPTNDLKAYLGRTKRLMQETDLDTVWLLNSFRAYETPYSEETLEAYVAGLTPHGIVLDYADQAAGRDKWMQKGGGAIAPVIRSTHLWSGQENLIGKIQAVVDAAPTRPHFFVVVVYPWASNITEAWESVNQLKGKYGSRVGIVSLSALFNGIQGSFTEGATRDVEQARGDPFVSIAFWDMNEATDHLTAMESYKAADNYTFAAYEGYLASQSVKRAAAAGNLFLVLLLLMGLVWGVEIFKRAGPKRRTKKVAANPAWALPGLGFAAVTYVFFAGLEKALEHNFWLYSSIFVAGAVIHLAPRLQKRMEAVLGERTPSAELILLLASSIVLMWELWAFVPLAGSAAMILSRFLRSSQMKRGTTGVWFGVGLAGALLLPLDWWTICISVAVLASVTLNMESSAPATESAEVGPKGKGVVFAATCLALAAIWTSLYRNRYFVEKTDVNIGLLQSLTFILLVVVPVIVLYAWNSSLRSRRFGSLSALTLSVVLWIALWQVQHLTAFCLLLLAIGVLASWAALSSSSGVDWNSGNTAKFVSSLLILSTIVIILIRMPAIVYSLYVVHLPTPIEYILYTPPLIMVFALADIVQTEAIVRAFRRIRKPPQPAGEEAEEK